MFREDHGSGEDADEGQPIGNLPSAPVEMDGDERIEKHGLDGKNPGPRRALQSMHDQRRRCEHRAGDPPEQGVKAVRMLARNGQREHDEPHGPSDVEPTDCGFVVHGAACLFRPVADSAQDAATARRGNANPARVCGRGLRVAVGELLADDAVMEQDCRPGGLHAVCITVQFS